MLWLCLVLVCCKRSFDRLRRHGRRRQCQCEPILIAADLQCGRHRWLPVPEKAADRVEGAHRRRLRCTVAAVHRHGPDLTTRRGGAQHRIDHIRRSFARALSIKHLPLCSCRPGLHPRRHPLSWLSLLRRWWRICMFHCALVTLGFVVPGLRLTWLFNRENRQAKSRALRSHLEFQGLGDVSENTTQPDVHRLAVPAVVPEHRYVNAFDGEW